MNCGLKSQKSLSLSLLLPLQKQNNKAIFCQCCTLFRRDIVFIVDMKGAAAMMCDNFSRI